MLSLVAALAALPALAADCDVDALTAAVKDATPTYKGARFAELAECDATAAASVAAEAVPRFLAGEDTNGGVLAALTVGAQAEVTSWFSGLQRNELAPTIKWLGQQCEGNSAVPAFFLNAHDSLGERFWSERWYVGLSDCRDPGVQKVLADAVGQGLNPRDPTRFFALLGLYARNLGANALPTLEEILPTVPENQRRLVVEAWADAADVGSNDGRDEAAAKAAIASLTQVREHIPASAADVLRNTLASLGDAAGAEAAVAVRWPDRLRDGRYHYLVAAQEAWTCSNGKSYATLHFGEVTDAATRWPDTLADQIRGIVEGPWKLGKAARKCKAEEPYLEVVIVDEPVDKEFDANAWVDAERQTLADRAGDARKLIEEEQATIDL